MADPRPLRIGTRGSPLALTQTEMVRRALVAANPELAAPGAIEVVVVRTTGDRVQDRRLAEIGGKGLFTKEIEEALDERRIDIAVHSMKDVETWIDARFVFPAILPREDPRDVWLSADGVSLVDLPPGAIVGTSSLRRQAQVLHRRPDVRVEVMRGNVDTRLAKLARGVAAATLLALAGLARLGMLDRATAVLSPEEMLPAAGQGAIGIEARTDDSEIVAMTARVDDANARAEVEAERAALTALDGNCRTPIGALGRVDPDTGMIRLDALVAMPDGTALWRTTRAGLITQAVALGRDAGEELRASADGRVFA